MEKMNVDNKEIVGIDFDEYMELCHDEIVHSHVKDVQGNRIWLGESEWKQKLLQEK